MSPGHGPGPTRGLMVTPGSTRSLDEPQACADALLIHHLYVRVTEQRDLLASALTVATAMSGAKDAGERAAAAEAARGPCGWAVSRALGPCRWAS